MINEKPKCYSYVRFSTPEQAKGDSLRRQLEASRKFAVENGLILDENLNFADLGVSAYNGANKNKGKLGEFLKLIENGKIEKGSYLIVESLDRISREEVIKAHLQFLDILQNGINIVTLTDGKIYSENSLNENFFELVFSLVEMSRANQESRVKSYRHSELWENKRNKAKEKILTKSCPNWLRVGESGEEFELITERVKIIKEMFESSRDGSGIQLISKKLNEKGVPAWGRGKGWHPSYIIKVLKNKAVIGYFQPHKNVKNKRIPVGEPIPGYFPKIISEDLFYEVQDCLKKRKFKGGRSGKISNLFGHIAKCGYCGGPMSYIDKGNSSGKGKYLVCDFARRGVECRYISIRYQEFEENFFRFCKGLDLKKIIHSESESKKVENFRSQISSIDGKVSDLKMSVENYKKSLNFADNDDYIKDLTDNIQNLYIKIKNNENNKNKLKEEIEKFETFENDFSSKIDDINQIINTEDYDVNKIDLRRRVKNKIYEIIDKVVFYPGGRMMTKDDIYELNVEGFVDENEKNVLLKEKVDKKSFYFEIYFKNGNYIRVVPDKNNNDEMIIDYRKNENIINFLNKKHKGLSEFEIDLNKTDFVDTCPFCGKGFSFQSNSIDGETVTDNGNLLYNFTCGLKVENSKILSSCKNKE